MLYLAIGLLVGFASGVGTLVFIIRVVEPRLTNEMFPPLHKAILKAIPSALPKGVRRSQRPDIRRVVLRPTNIDAPPARVTQALFRQRPTRKLNEDE